MKNTSLCYLERDGRYLMLHRVKKPHDPNQGKWIGVGGKFEEGEAPEECAAREIFEETGIRVRNLSLRGIVTFLSDAWESEYMFLFTGNDFDEPKALPDCPEGELRWIPKEELPSLSLWEGDRIFLPMLAENIPFFSLKFTYKGDRLTAVSRFPDDLKGSII